MIPLSSLPSDIHQRLVLDFGTNAKIAYDALGRFVDSDPRRDSTDERNRIVRCLLRLAEGDMQKLEHHIAVALRDRRDVISWAEYDSNERRTHDLSIGFDRLPSAAPDCVGALIRNQEGRVFVQRRSSTRRVFPGVWDIVGGHLEPGETAYAALAREVQEETGWVLSKIVAPISDWTWEYAGTTRQEVDYLVEVTGDLQVPRLEVDKHDAYAWVGLADVDLMMEGRVDGDRRLLDIVVRALRYQ